MNSKQKILTIAIGIFLITFASQIYLHEQVHAKNFERAGATVKFGYEFGNWLAPVKFYTQATSQQLTDLDNLQLANSINDAIGYNLYPYLLGIMSLLLLILAALVIGNE